MIELELVYNGSSAEEGLIDFYDIARALTGFQRSLALTTHFVVNGEIITQAPFVSGFDILVPPFEQGSWKSRAVVVFSAATMLMSAGKDSPLGQMVTSVYDYALMNTMGFHVDYEKTIQQLYFEHLEKNKITADRLDSLCEKIETNIADMHRPIVISQSATRAVVNQRGSEKRQLGPDFSLSTYEYVRQTVLSPKEETVEGYVMGYNINTYKGRIFSQKEGRIVPFELGESARTALQIGLITSSQHLNGQRRFDPQSLVSLGVNELLSPTEKVKRLLVRSVKKPTAFV